MQRISAIVIPTFKRVESLERTLLSYVVQTKTFEHEVEFVIGDDSDSAEYRAHTRALLRSIGRSHGVRIAYAGKEEKNKFVDALSGVSGMPRELVAFGLLGDDSAAATGANRNALMLDTVGQLIYSADDDTVSMTPFVALLDRPRRTTRFSISTGCHNVFGMGMMRPQISSGRYFVI
jgi:hypothetical protein